MGYAVAQLVEAVRYQPEGQAQIFLSLCCLRYPACTFLKRGLLRCRSELSKALFLLVPDYLSNVCLDGQCETFYFVVMKLNKQQCKVGW